MVVVGVCLCRARANKQTDQTTTLCVQEVEIYLERWEVLGALVDVCVERRARPTHTLNTYLRKLESWDQYGGMCVLVFVSRATNTHTYTNREH